MVPQHGEWSVLEGGTDLCHAPQERALLNIHSLGQGGGGTVSGDASRLFQL